MLSLLLLLVVGAEPKPVAKVVSASEVTKEIEDNVNAIDRVKLTKVKAEQQLKSVLSAFAAKRYKVSVTYTLNDVDEGGTVELTCDDMQRCGTPKEIALPKNDKRFQDIFTADKGDKFTVSGTAVAFYTHDGSYNLPKDTFLISLRPVALPPDRQPKGRPLDFLDPRCGVGVYLTGFKVVVAKPMEEEKK